MNHKMKEKFQVIDRRNFIKKTGLGALGLTLAPSLLAKARANGRLRTAHIGLGMMGKADLEALASHNLVDVVALCDVDAKLLAESKAKFPNAKTYKDYREMLKEMENGIDAVIVSTPDHTHAPASLMAMKMDKPVYCQKPLTHHVS